MDVLRRVTLFCRRNDSRLEASVEAQPRRILRRIDPAGKGGKSKKSDRKATFCTGSIPECRHVGFGHLSPDEPTARAVGTRRRKPIVLRVDARAMRPAGHLLFRTPNGVWLTDTVPASFVSGFDDE
jgi:hypothetical protein